jgi:cardiolipin synthase A/B
MNASTPAPMPISIPAPMPARLTLLQGGCAFFPLLIEDINQATRYVWLETYIFDFTPSPVAQGPGSAGLDAVVHTADIAAALMAAAQRGVQVRLLFDAVGTGVLANEWRDRFDQAGVQWRAFSPLGWVGLLNPVRWRRLHRKLCVVDGQVAYCGGINLLDDYYDPQHGVLTAPRFDFCVRLQACTAVADVGAAMDQLWQRMQALRKTVQAARQREFGQLLDQAQSSVRALMPSQLIPTQLIPTQLIPTQLMPSQLSQTADRQKPTAPGDELCPKLLLRDNVHNRKRIERAYRHAIGSAQREIIIANAYFLPGHKLRRGLIHAAKRGVKVQLLLQGRYEYFMQFHAAKPVYGALLAAGVEIHEYEASFLHAKVAVVDAGLPSGWATVGSSNLDPLSLLLAREANLEIRDPAFIASLRQRLHDGMQAGGRPVDPARYLSRPLWQRGLNWLAYGLMRLALLVAGKRY